MQTVSSKNVQNIKRVFERDYEIDRSLPAWARRSHPVVRRHLGVFWRVLPPQLDVILRNALLFSAVVMFTVVAPFLYTMLLPLSLLSLAILPFALFYYARTLYDLASDASRAMVREIDGNTLPLLLAAPISPRELLLSKIAGSLWRQSDPMNTLLNIVLYSQLPGVMVIYINVFPPQEYQALTQIMTVIVYLASLVRIPLEMFMIATIGQYIGLTTRGRSTAAATTLGIVVFYFVMVNALRLLPLSVAGDLIVNVALPVLMPPIISAGVLWFSMRALSD